ncbi:MAG: arylesterase [Betaproteobacteria bacterium]|nr:arylesterase [Betaproteobacteria bacterium]
MRPILSFCLLVFALICLPAPAQAAKTILVMGDSLSAGYGIRPEQAWPALLDKRLHEKRFDYSVANLSISGETTAGGRSRLGAALKAHRPAIVIIVLGANDGLRGLPLGQMRDNLNAMIDSARASGAVVALFGMRLPPNYGPFANEFQRIFGEIAQAKKTPLVDFLIEPVAAQPRYFQSDNLHPIAEAEPLILDHIWPTLLPLLK